MTFDQKRDGCVLFMRAQSELSNQAADRILVATSPAEIEAIVHEIFYKIDQLTVEEFIHE